MQETELIHAIKWQEYVEAVQVIGYYHGVIANTAIVLITQHIRVGTECCMRT